jgi:hypothetical protein
MKNLIVTMVAFVLAAMLNINSAKAQPTPAARHCLSKDECVARLLGNMVYVERKGQPLEILMPMGGTNLQTGYITAMNGWIATTWLNDTMIYLYNLETETYHQVDAGYECKEMIIFEDPNDPGTYVLRTPAPAIDSVVFVNLTTFATGLLSISTTNPYTITLGRNDFFVGGVDSTITRIELLNNTPFPLLTHQSSITKVRYWQDPNTQDVDDNDLVFFNYNSAIYTVGPHSGTYEEVLFYGGLPGSIVNNLAVNSMYVLAADTSQDAWLINIQTPTSHVALNAIHPLDVALSPSTAYVVEGGSNPATLAFDMNGNPIPEWTMGNAQKIAYIAPIHPPFCGNGLQEDDPLTATVEEACDGSDLDNRTCLTEGFDGGELICNGSCNGLDTNGCFYTCGNNRAAPTEECDGSDLKNQSCTSLGYVSGTLSCTASCELDLSTCESCGNNRIDFEEVCDGTEFGTATCQTEGFDGGALTCNSECSQIDTTNCTICGDNLIEGDEMCEGEDLNGHTCESLGFGKGTLLCSSSCLPDVSLCPPPPEPKAKKGCNTVGTSGSGQGIIFVLMLMIALLVRSSRKRRQ